ncbi:MAG: hypothetical protein RLZZ436_1809 [Planctomycetota bacterium]
MLTPCAPWCEGCNRGLPPDRSGVGRGAHQGAEGVTGGFRPSAHGAGRGAHQGATPQPGPSAAIEPHGGSLRVKNYGYALVTLPAGVRTRVRERNRGLPPVRSSVLTSAFSSTLYFPPSPLSRSVGLPPARSGVCCSTRFGGPGFRSHAWFRSSKSCGNGENFRAHGPPHYDCSSGVSTEPSQSATGRPSRS